MAFEKQRQRQIGEPTTVVVDPLLFGADESRCNCYDQWRMLKHYAGSCVAPGEFRTKLDSGITDDGIAEDG